MHKAAGMRYKQVAVQKDGGGFAIADVSEIYNTGQSGALFFAAELYYRKTSF